MKNFRFITILAFAFIATSIGCSKNDNDNSGKDLYPTVVSTDPLSDQTDVARNKVVSLTFSEEMDPATINTTSFMLKQGATGIEGVVEYTGTTATFTPLNALNAESNYSAKITTGAKSKKGNPLKNDYTWNFTIGGSTASIAPVDLGTAINYVILSKTAINNSGTSAVTGDLGLSPAATSYITGLALTNNTGYATSAQVTGRIFAADMADPTPTNLTTAVDNMITAYNEISDRTITDFLELGAGNIGGKTLTTGIYKWTNSVAISSDVTISGSSTDVWIFQIAKDLTLSSAVKVILKGGAQAKNVYWQVAGEVTMGTTSHFEGVILSMTGITLQTGATMNGRALAQTAVVLDGNTVTQPN